MAKIIKMSGISSNMSGKSADCVTMSECVANPLVRPKMSKNTQNVWQLASMLLLFYGNNVTFLIKFASDASLIWRGQWNFV